MQKLITLTQKITELNDVIISSVKGKDDRSIIKKFTEKAISILSADFGFAWWKYSDSDPYKLAYKSANTPYKLFLPRENASHYTAIRDRKPFFVSVINKEDYETSDITPYMKSFVIIPIYHEGNIYGTLTLCFKKRHEFTPEDKVLIEAIGHSTAKTITIHRLVKSDILLREEMSKTEFIANATHEFRTPLAVIKGNIDLAMRGHGENLKSAMSAFRAINHEVNHLSSILSDLTLITSKTWDVNNRFKFGHVDLKSLITTVIRRCKPLAHKKNISIRAIQVPNFILFGDKISLEKLFMNLVKNSIIYGKKNGHTKIEVQRSKIGVIVNVVDDGIGISKEYLPHIFDRFYRVNKYHDSGGCGTGLGLSIVKWIAENHGGKVSVKSELKKGSVFSVELPKSK